MATVAALIVGARERARMTAAVQDRADIAFCDTEEELLRMVTNTRLAAVIIALWGDNRRSRVSTILGLRRRSSTLPIYAYCGLEPVDVQEIVRAGSAGIDDIVLHGAEEAWIALRDVTGGSERERAAHGVLRATDRIVPEPAKRLFRYTLAHTHPRPTVEAAAAEFRVPRSTLFAQFKDAGLPAPGEIISWARLLFACFVLEAWGHSVEKTAYLAGFESGAALRGLLKRKTGLRPRELRARGGLFYLIQRFERALGASPPQRELDRAFTPPVNVAADRRVQPDDKPISNSKGNVASEEGNVA